MIFTPWFNFGRKEEPSTDLSRLQKQKEDLVSVYQRTGLVSCSEALEAFLKVPREEFLPEEQRAYAYVDRPLPLLGTGQTISAPHMTVMILDYLLLFQSRQDEKVAVFPVKSVLEVGGGSGYQAALIAEALRSQGTPFKIYSFEIVPKLVQFAEENLQRAGYDQEVHIIAGDGTLGFKKAAPFERVLLTAAGPQIPPPLVEQLSIGGILCMPLGGTRFWQTMIRVRKTDERGSLDREDLSSVAFVPLRGEHGI
ncbi:MAG: protein-L-isoaspartate O-methyltransferase [Candidatus Hodarchaeota archaeon]